MMHRNIIPKSKAKRQAYAAYGSKQPRPALRKQGTRKGAVLAAVKEAQR